MQAYDLVVALEDLDELEFQAVGDFNRGNVGVYWAGRGISPWERHPEDDELLYVIEGHVTIEVLTEIDSIEVSVPEGSAFVVPRNHWHRQKVEDLVKEMYVTPGKSETSSADDPRGVGGLIAHPRSGGGEVEAGVDDVVFAPKFGAG